MSRKKIVLIYSLFIISTILIGVNFNIPPASAASLNGRILLQVQSHGEAWYLNPVNSRRYYLGRPEDAYDIMRLLGLGISNKDFSLINKNSSRLAGRILIKVEDFGRAYYFDPSDLRLYYLGRPDDAYNIMRQRGLGITNSDLSKILISTNSKTLPGSELTTVSNKILAPVDAVQTEQNYFNNSLSSFVYNFKYKNLAQKISLDLSLSLYNQYSALPKVLTYQLGHEPANLRESFYDIFLKPLAGDLSLDTAIYKIKSLALQNNLSADETVDLAMAFVQFIPYDQAKLSENLQANNNPYFPYETLYLNRGVCSDKTFLAVSLLRKLGYGAAILDFPDLNHTAAGILCPLVDSINSSGYCYIETTNYFPAGVIPQTISSGQAKSQGNEFNDLFNQANLGKIEILQKTKGQVYYQVASIKIVAANLKNENQYLIGEQENINNLAATLKTEENYLKEQKIIIDNYYNNGQLSLYNSLLPDYNNLVNEYNNDLGGYRTKVSDYNARSATFYQAAKDFYQQ